MLLLWFFVVLIFLCWLCSKLFRKSYIILKTGLESHETSSGYVLSTCNISTMTLVVRYGCFRFCLYSNVYKASFIMSRKIYIYNRAALLYKRGAFLRNWMQKVRLHRAAFHFPRASPKVMQPCIFSFVETSIFCPNSIFSFMETSQFFWQRRKSRNLYFATMVTFATKSG